MTDLKKEVETFEQQQGNLIFQHGNGYVVIYGNEVLDVWKDREDALKEGYKKYGNVPFLVRDINKNRNNIDAYISKNLKFSHIY